MVSDETKKEVCRKLKISADSCRTSDEIDDHVRTKFRPNQYFRPAFKRIMHVTISSSAPKFVAEYHFLGAVEAANEKHGYDYANFGIFGGHKREGETVIDCAFREMEEECSIKIESRSQVFDDQDKIRRELEVPTLPDEIIFLGQLYKKKNRRWEQENMKAYFMIFRCDSLRLRRLVIVSRPDLVCSQPFCFSL